MALVLQERSMYRELEQQIAVTQQKKLAYSNMKK